VYRFTVCVCIAVLRTVVAGLLARSQYPEGPATGHLGTGFSWFPCVYKQMLRWFPTLQVATACFSCSSPDSDFLDPYFIFMYMHYNHYHRATAHLELNILIILYYIILYYIILYYIILYYIILYYIILYYIILYYIILSILLLLLFRCSSQGRWDQLGM